MPHSLTKQRRKHLADITQQARDLAEEAARAALQNLAVHEGKYRAHMDEVMTFRPAREPHECV